MATMHFALTIERTPYTPSQQPYVVWVSPLGDGDMDDPRAFVVGQFPTFDAATEACLVTFPGQAIHCVFPVVSSNTEAV